MAPLILGLIFFRPTKRYRHTREFGHAGRLSRTSRSPVFLLIASHPSSHGACHSCPSPWTAPSTLRRGWPHSDRRRTSFDPVRRMIFWLCRPLFIRSLRAKWPNFVFDPPKRKLGFPSRSTLKSVPFNLGKLSHQPPNRYNLTRETGLQPLCALPHRPG